MSKNDGAGLEPAKVTQSHPFTQTNGINESSLSAMAPPHPSTHQTPPLLFCVTLFEQLIILSRLPDAMHSVLQSLFKGPVTEQHHDPGKPIVIFIGCLRNVPVPFSQLSFIKSV